MIYPASIVRLGNTPMTIRLASMRILYHGCEPRAQLAGAYSGSHEIDMYTLRMSESDVRDHSIGIRAPEMGGVPLDAIWD